MARFDGTFRGPALGAKRDERREHLHDDDHRQDVRNHGIHFHSLSEQRAIALAEPLPFHDLESERRLMAGPFHHPA